MRGDWLVKVSCLIDSKGQNWPASLALYWLGDDPFSPIFSLVFSKRKLDFTHDYIQFDTQVCCSE